MTSPLPFPRPFWGSSTAPPPTVRYRAVHRAGVVLEAFCYGVHPAPTWVRGPGVLVPIPGSVPKATLRTKFGPQTLSARDWVVFEDGALTRVPDEMFQVLFLPTKG
jgi:hypothetical protein